MNSFDFQVEDDRDDEFPDREDDDAELEYLDPWDRYRRFFSDSLELRGDLFSSLEDPMGGGSFDLARFGERLSELGDSVSWSCSRVLASPMAFFDSDWTVESQALGILVDDLEHLSKEGRRLLGLIPEPDARLVRVLQEGFKEVSQAIASAKLLADLD